MKKIFALLIALFMLISLAACEDKKTSSGKDGDGSEEETSKPDIGDILGGIGGSTSDSDTDIGDILGGTSLPDIGGDTSVNLDDIFGGSDATDTVWGEQDAATKQALIDEGKKEGIDVSFGPDGSTTFTDTETGEVTVQNPDGSWTFFDDEGNSGTIGSSWPDNEFTRLLPKPSLTILTTANNGDEFSAVFQNASMDDMKKYANLVASAGFDVNATTEDYTAQGMDIFSYSAVNADGYSIAVSYSMGVSAIVVTKP